MTQPWQTPQPGTAGWQSVPVDCGSGVCVTLEVFACAGERPGPTALVIAGIHGDEYEGPAAVWEVAEALRPQQVSGTVVLIPVASPLAFDAGTRTTPPDAANLARVFPGDPNGSPTPRLAHFLFETFGRPCDYLIDLHSGGVEYEFLPVAGFRGEPDAANPSYRAACAMQLPVVWQLPDTAGVFSREVWKRGAVVIGAEYLGAGQLSADGVRDYTRGIRACLGEWGVLEGSPAPAIKPPDVYTSTWLLCPATGIYATRFRLGDAFAAGDELATIRGPRGELLASVTATEPGTIMALRSKAYARQGDWAVLAGRHVDPALPQ